MGVGCNLIAHKIFLRIMDYLFDVWSDVIELIKKANCVFLFLDYDGTLTPIVKRPQLAILSDETRTILQKISKLPKYSLCIVSGRSLKDIKRMVGIKGICYVGNHGLEADCIDFKYTNPDAVKCIDIINEIHKKLLIETRSINGIIIENKGLTETVHYRMVSNKDLSRLRKIFRKIVNFYLSDGKIKTSRNKKTLEILPNIDWDKGKIVLKLWGDSAEKGILPIYVGDDRTDADAFKALKRFGIPVLVSENPGKSNAQYYLKDVKDVIKFLNMLLN